MASGAVGPEDTSDWLEANLRRARVLLDELGLDEVDTSLRPCRGGHASSLALACRGSDGREFLLKVFAPPAEARFYPPGVRVDDYARRETAFYRLIDIFDPERREVPAPRTVAIDPGDPPRWLLLQRVHRAVGPAEEVLGSDHVFGLLEAMRAIKPEVLLGRRDFPVNRWDTVSYFDRVLMMQDPVAEVIGSPRWAEVQRFFREAIRWTEMRPHAFVHGDFTESNILVDADGKALLLDFERVGAGNLDHDFAWFWIHSERSREWKRRLVERYFGGRVGSERIVAEWGIRAALVYLALRRLRFGHLVHGTDDPQRAANEGLLDAALFGGPDLFPA